MERKHDLEDELIDHAAERIMEGWKAAGQAIDEVEAETETACILNQETETPLVELTPRPPAPLVSTAIGKASVELAMLPRSEKAETRDSYSDELTARALSLLGN